MPAALCVTMCTSMSPDARMTLDEVPGPGEQRDESRSARDTDDELCRVRCPGEPDQGCRDVLADDLVVGATELLDQDALRRERSRVGCGEPVLAGDVHGEQLAAA